MRDRSVLVIGGTGGVGDGIVRALLAGDDFARVIVSSRDGAKLAALRERPDARRAPVVIEGGVGDAAQARALREAAEAHGPLGAVVASLGGWWEGPALTDLADADWDDELANLLRPHFVAARAFVPALEAGGGRYLLIGGGAALTPVPGSTLVSIAGAAQLMFARALVAERPGRPPIVEELVIDGPVKTSARHHGPLTEGEITAREVGDVVVAMLRDGSTGTWPHVSRSGPVVTMRPKPRLRSSRIRPSESSPR